MGGGGERIDNEEARHGICPMREAWARRKGNLHVEVRDLPGEVRVIERTNFRSERGGREGRLAIRGRTEEEIARYVTRMAAVGNWGRAGNAQALG